TLIKSNQEIDGILVITRDRGEERRQPRAGRLGIEIRGKLLGEFGGIGEREIFREWLDEENERIYHRHVGDEIEREGEFAGLLRKDEACEPVSIRILLPVHEVLRRRHPQRVTFDPRTAMGGWAQPDDLRREADRPIVAVASDVVETGEDRHTVLCCAKAITLLRYFRCNFWAGRYLPRGCRGGGEGRRKTPTPGGRRPAPPQYRSESAPSARCRQNGSRLDRAHAGGTRGHLRPRKTRGGMNGERAMPTYPTDGHNCTRFTVAGCSALRGRGCRGRTCS